MSLSLFTYYAKIILIYERLQYEIFTHNDKGKRFR